MAEHAVKFYHETNCRACTKDNICVNTHRTDFVGYDHANRFFNIIGARTYFPDGSSIQLRSNISRLQDLAEKLMEKQGENFFLNEYPEECDHLQYIDLDENIPDDLLAGLIAALEELTIGGKVLTLRNTLSGKVHLIMDVPGETNRHSRRKKAIAKWLSSYLYEAADVSEYYTEEKWRDEIFDAKAAGIRSALSAKVKGGKLEPNKGVYAPPNADLGRLSLQEKVDIVIKYSIYNPPRTNWTLDTLAAFEQAETAETAAATPRPTVSEYDPLKKSIQFLGESRVVSGALIDEFIRLLPALWSDKKHWYFTLKQVKTAAGLVNDFDPKYFLHEWSAKSKDLYNEAGNNDQYARCQVDPAAAGSSITWLRNKAGLSLIPDPNLSRGDLGLAEIFSELAADKIKVISNDGSCYLWDDNLRLWQLRGNKWIGNEVSRELEKVYLEHAKKLKCMKVVDVAKSLKSWEKKIDNILKYRGAMDVVHKAMPMLEDTNFIKKINLQPDLLPIRGGLVVDLQTGETSRRLPSHNFTFECPVNIDRDEGRRQIVEKFMLDICCGDRELLRYFQVALGYCITGCINEKAVFVWWGALGDNGKSTVMNLLKAILGEYCKPASKCLFIKTKSDSKLTPEREVLKDTRLVVFSETAADDELNDEVLKMASGDDPIRVNPKYQAEYEFRSYAKLLIASNHKPKINVSDSAMVRRVKFLPFLTKFVDSPHEEHERKKDKQLARRMETDLLDAFFTWVLDGARSWYEAGLVDIPTVMQKATAEFIAENDEIGEFLAEETEPAEAVILSNVLYRKYCDWCKTHNAKAKGSKTFSQDMEKKHMKEKRRNGYVFLGLKFKELDPGLNI